MKKSEPMVSIRIPNYNYASYLRQCLDSVLEQTYDNFEVIFRDNNSTDESYEIALEYRKKFKERGIFLGVYQNRYNIGSDLNSRKTAQDSHGELHYVLASDDAIAPDFIEKCVTMLTEYPNVSMVMTHRDEIDENGIIKSTAPFYDRSCLIPGEEQAAVFMMAGIAIPGQRMGNDSKMQKVRMYDRAYDVAGDWFRNFLYACCGDVVYIDQPLCHYRVHSKNETNESERALTGIFEHYELINYFNFIGRELGMKKVCERYGDAVKKLGSMCRRYALKMIKNGYMDIAKKYLNLALVFDPDIIKDVAYEALKEMTACGTNDYLMEKIAIFEKNFSLDRKVSYEPPEHAVTIKI